MPVCGLTDESQTARRSAAHFAPLSVCMVSTVNHRPRTAESNQPGPLSIALTGPYAANASDLSDMDCAHIHMYCLVNTLVHNRPTQVADCVCELPAMNSARDLQEQAIYQERPDSASGHETYACKHEPEKTQTSRRTADCLRTHKLRVKPPAGIAAVTLACMLHFFVVAAV